MKALLICEARNGKLLDTSYELLAFAERIGAEIVLLLVGSKSSLPNFDGKLYLAETEKYGEYNPDLHKKLILEAIRQENPDLIGFLHSAYGWDLAPRLAAALEMALISEVVEVVDGGYEVPCYNAKLRQTIAPKTSKTIVTIQLGAFSSRTARSGKPIIEPLVISGFPSLVEFVGYEAADQKGADLTRAEVIVSAGRGIGKKENISIVSALAKALGGEVGATRPVVDAGWLDPSQQVGLTGQTVHPKLYIACGISGSIQHVAGMKKSEFIVAINRDKDAPIGAVADVLVVADVLQFVPLLTARLEK